MGGCGGHVAGGDTTDLGREWRGYVITQGRFCRGIIAQGRFLHSKSKNPHQSDASSPPIWSSRRLGIRGGSPAAAVGGGG